jgi:hypothetical protein
MKYFKFAGGFTWVAIIGYCLLWLTGCASQIDVAQRPLAVATHNDLAAASAYAAAHGYPARGAVWNAIDVQLSACEDAITAAESMIRAPVPAPPGIFTAFEIGAEAVGEMRGLPAAVKINCAPLPTVNFTGLKVP